MYLKSLEIFGFKSFAKKGVLEFTSTIAAIVGPNGSGKSNVAEAFRFVLGEQSIKSLRGKKGEDLIFNGSKTTPKMNRAAVKVIFDNARRVLPIDFNEVIIERVVHRDSVNQYLINGSVVRLKDIIELLAAAHIGASGHHIISQGEADRILSANIAERRDMIEDALGLKLYLYKKNESVRRLEKTEENITHVQSLRREIAPHIKFLSKQVEKVEKAEQMKNDLLGFYREYLKREEEFLAYSKEKLEIEKKPLLATKETLSRELNEARRILEAGAKGDKKSVELLRLEEALQKLQESRDRVSRDLGRTEGVILSLRHSLSKRSGVSTPDLPTVPLADLEKIVSHIDTTVQELETEESVSLLKKTLLAIRTTLLDFVKSRRHVVSGETGESLTEQIETSEREKIELEEKLKELETDTKRHGEQVSLLRQAIEREKDSNRDAEKAVFKIMAEQNTISGKLSALEGREATLRLIAEDFKRELGEAGALVGSAILTFRDTPILGEDARHLTQEEIAREERSKQEGRRRLIEKIKIKLEDAGGAGGEEVKKEYKEATERDTFLEREIADLERTAESLKKLIVELEEKLDTEFKVGLTKINQEFQKFFALMFGGGAARLEVVRQEKRRGKSVLDSLSDFEEGLRGEGDESNSSLDAPVKEKEGIDITVSLPHKKTKGLMMLSGGERALTSIALLFAVSQVNPPPFIILDETDAALDEANSRKYGDMIESLSKYSQLILITHNRETMSRAGVLYGVTMGADGYSKLLSIKFDEAVRVAK